MTKFLTAALFALIFIFSSVEPGLTSTADDKTELQSQIDSKNRELERINLELQSTKSNLEEVQKKKNLLQREISTLQGSMKQLDLSIKADEITLQKLDLEINSLSFDIEDIEKTVGDKQAGIEQIFRQMQRGNGDNMLILLLRHDSLETALGEIKSLSDLREQLGKDIHELAALKARHAETLGQVSTKKTSVEFHKTTLKDKKVIIAGQRQETATILAQTQSQESVYETRLSDLQKQQNAMHEEIEQIEERLKKNFNTNVLPTEVHDVLSWPIGENAGRITQHFGEVSRLYGGKPHNGMDIGVPVGTPIIAAADGVVMAADNNDVSALRKYQYGKYVLIKHSNNLATLYAHLSRYTVSAGQTVKRGEIIGYAGSTGYSTGPHLHFGAYWAPSIELKRIPPAAGLVPIGVAVNPEGYL